MVDFSRLIRQAEEAKGRPPRPKRAGGARKPRRKAAKAPAPPARPVVEEPPIAEPVPGGTRKPVPPPEAILEALIPTDPVAPSARVEPPGEDVPPVRPAAPPPAEAIAEAAIPPDSRGNIAEPELAEDLPAEARRRPAPAEAIAESEIPPDPVRPAPPAAPQPSVPPSPPGLWGTREDLARMAQDEPDEGPEEAGPVAEAIQVAPSEPEPPPAPPRVAEPPRESEAVAPAVDATEPTTPEPMDPPPPIDKPVEAGREEPVERPPALHEAAARAEGPAQSGDQDQVAVPIDVGWEDEAPAPVEDGLTPVQRNLVAEVRSLLGSLDQEAALRAQPATGTAVLEEPRPEAPAPVPATAQEVPQEAEIIAKPDLSPQQERLIAEVKAILSDLGVPPRREEERVAAPVDRIEDVPASLPGTEAVDLPVEEASLPAPAPYEPEPGGLGEILGVVRDEASQAVADLDERAALAEALSPSPPLPEGLTETAPPAEEPLPEAVAEAFAPPLAEPTPPEPPPPQQEAPPPIQDEPPPREEIMPFPPPMAEPPPPEEAPPRRRRAPFDPFSDLRRRGKDLLDVGILLVGLAWLAGGLYTGDAVSWLIAIALVAAPSVDLYLRTTARRSESA